MREGELSLLRK